jgi:hypothetical protein
MVLNQEKCVSIVRVMEMKISFLSSFARNIRRSLSDTGGVAQEEVVLKGSVPFRNCGSHPCGNN